MLENPKGPPFQFFWHCEIFFRNFSHFKFLMFCDRMDVEKLRNVDNFGSVPLSARQGLALAGPGAPLSSYFLPFRFSSSANLHLEVLLLFLSLGYGADLGRSRLVCLPVCFQVPARLTILIYYVCYRTFSIFFRNFETFARRLPNVTFLREVFSYKEQ